MTLHAGRDLTAREIVVDCSDIWGMAEYYDEVQLRMAKARTNLKRSLETDDTEQVKKKKLEDGTEVYYLPLKYNRCVNHSILFFCHLI